MKAIIIHGANGNPNEHWFKWLGKQLKGMEILIPQFPIEDEQNLGNWMKVIEKIGVNEDTILIGHSIGCAFILSVLEKYKAKAAFLIGGFIGKLNISYDVLNETFAEKKFNWNEIKKNCNIFFVYNSDNDPYVPLKKGEELAKKLRIKLKIIKNAGHFRLEDGYGKFPLLLEDVKAVIEK